MPLLFHHCVLNTIKTETSQYGSHPQQYSESADRVAEDKREITHIFQIEVTPFQVKIEDSLSCSQFHT